MVSIKKSNNISSWAKFEKQVRDLKPSLLLKLDDYNDAVLIAGCQRSGTTILAKIIAESEGMVDFQFGKDAELDAALILSGRVQHREKGRYCFQTTFVNDSFPEYFEHSNYKLVWIIRNPVSVVYSMLYNWKSAALKRLFRHCGRPYLSASEKSKYERFGILAIPPIKRACYSYNAKVDQLKVISENLDSQTLLVVDYDEIALNKEKLLPYVYNFIGLDYQEQYAGKIHSKSTEKFKKFTDAQRAVIGDMCLPYYEEAKKLRTVFE